MAQRKFCGRGFSFALGKKTLIMGILNITPDSFSDGGQYFSAESAVEAAMTMQRQGADLIDVGGESTRPGHTPVSEAEEMARVIPVIRQLRKKLGIPISVDTRKPGVALAAAIEGAHIINDVGGFEDDAICETAAAHGLGCIAMHHSPCITDPVAEVELDLLARRAKLIAFGVLPESICLDVGIGFGKTYEQNLALLGALNRINFGGCCVLLAASRKSFIEKTCPGLAPDQRLPGTLAAHTIGLCKGADMLRVHDVPEAVQAARICDAVLRGQGG